MIPDNEIKIIIPDKYLKDPTEEPIIGFIRYLRDQGKDCNFLGFNEAPTKLPLSARLYNYVILIDGIKYYGCVGGSPDTNYYADFFVVNDEEHDYIENHFNKRVSQILDALEHSK